MSASCSRGVSGRTSRFVVLLCACALMVALAFASLAGCGGTQNKGGDAPAKQETTQPEASATRQITDMAGRTVEIPSKVDKVIGVGASSLRFISYMQAVDKVVGVEEAEHKPLVARCYSFVYADQFAKLPIIGKGGSGGTTPFEEEILKVKPQVIIASLDKDTAQSLQDKLKIPVVCMTVADTVFNEDFDKNINLLGDVLGKKERAKEILEYVTLVKKDFDKRLGGLKDDQMKTAYPAGVSFRGSHGFSGTEGEYSPFMIAHVKNVSDVTKHVGPFDIDPEKVLELQPEYMFVDINNFKLVQDDYAERPEFFNQLNAVKNGNIYSQISFRWYATNVELALANAYYVAKVCYPEQFKDVDPIKKFDEITQFFDGKPLYAEFEKQGMKFEKLDIAKK